MFLKDRPTTIAELVPNLEHLGLVPVDEQPSVFENEHATVYLDDVGVQMATTARCRTVSTPRCRNPSSV